MLIRSTINDTIDDILWHIFYKYNLENRIFHHEN